MVPLRARQLLPIVALCFALYAALLWASSSGLLRSINEAREERHHATETASEHPAQAWVVEKPPCADKNSIPKFKYDVCAVTRVRNVAFMLTQWIEYHRVAGVNMFFIADDCSTDLHLGKNSTKSILGKYQRLGVVDFFDPRKGGAIWTAFGMGCPRVHVPNEDAYFRRLFARAQSKCKWIGVWDVDEYITSSDMKYFRNLSSFLESDPNCTLCGSSVYKRLPLLAMGSDRLESNPLHRPLIENHRLGNLFLQHIKTFSFSPAAETWTFSLWPVFKESYMKLYDFSPRFYMHQNLFPSEYFSGPDDNGKTCLLPASPVFLKHFIFMSWQEYIMGRGSATRTSNGKLSPWAGTYSRQRWLQGGNKVEYGCLWGNEYTLHMIPLTLAGIANFNAMD